MSTAQKLSIGLILLSVLTLILGTLLPWWTGAMDTGSLEIGLRKMSLCVGAVCRDRGLATDSAAAGWARLGSVVFAASYVAAFFLAASGVACARKRIYKTGFWVSGVTALFTGLMAIVFLFTHPEFGELVPTYGMACTLAGSFVGALSITLAKTSMHLKAC